tara:strand:- start:5001 stop:5306 length:306 start_codon:yes stop_codon:yes gene_type:complete
MSEPARGRNIDSRRTVCIWDSDLLMNTLETIEIDVSVELGAAVLPVHHLLRMGRGAVIELDAFENDAMRIYANNTLIAKGEVQVDEGQLNVVVTEKVIKPA